MTRRTNRFSPRLARLQFSCANEELQARDFDAFPPEAVAKQRRREERRFQWQFDLTSGASYENSSAEIFSRQFAVLPRRASFH